MAFGRFLVILTVLVAICGKVLGQKSLKIDEKFRKKSLIEVFDRLERNYNLVIAYEPAQVKGIEISSLVVKKQSLERTMRLLLRRTNLNFRFITPQQISIYNKNKSVAQTDNALGGHYRTIRGSIFHALNQDPLPLSNVQIKGRPVGVTSDEEGQFEFKFKSYETDTLVVSYVGFSKKYIPLNSDNPVRFLQIELVPKTQAYSLADVVISEGSDQFVQLGKTSRNFSLHPQKLGNLSGLGENDFLRAAQLLPGISNPNESASELYIRGGTPDQNLFLLDGITIYQPGHFYGAFSNINTEAVKSISIHRGGFGAQYGGRVSGVVDMIGKPRRIAQLHTGGGINLLSANAFAEIPAFDKKVALLVAGRSTFSDIEQNPFYSQLFDNYFQHGIVFKDRQQRQENPDFITSQPSFGLFDLNTKLLFNPSHKDLISVSGFYSADRLAYQYQDSLPTHLLFNSEDRQSIINKGLSMNWHRQWTDGFFSKTTLAYSAYHKTYQYDSEFLGVHGKMSQSTFQENLLNDLAFRQDNQLTISSSQQTNFGIHITRPSIALTQHQKTFDSTSTFQTNQAYLFAGYLQHTYQPVKQLSLEMGLRNTWYTGTQKNYIEPRLSLQYNLSSQLSLNASWGQYRQFINRIWNSNSLGVGEDFWALSNDSSLEVAGSEHWIVGTKYETPDFLLNIELYHKKLSGLTSYSLFYNPELNELENIHMTTGGRGTAQGLDVLVQKKIGKYYSGWISYSLSKVTHHFEDLNKGLAFAANHDQRHQVNIVNTVSIDNLELSTTWTFASGRPFTQPTLSTTDVSPESSFPFFWEINSINTERIPAYHRLDFSASYSIPFAKQKGKLIGGITLFNVYNRKNISSKLFEVSYPTSSSQNFQIQESNKYLLGFTPNLFLNVKF